MTNVWSRHTGGSGCTSRTSMFTCTVSARIVPMSGTPSPLASVPSSWTRTVSWNVWGLPSS